MSDTEAELLGLEVLAHGRLVNAEGQYRCYCSCPVHVTANHDVFSFWSRQPRADGCDDCQRRRARYEFLLTCQDGHASMPDVPCSFWWSPVDAEDEPPLDCPACQQRQAAGLVRMVCGVHSGVRRQSNPVTGWVPADVAAIYSDRHSAWGELQWPCPDCAEHLPAWLQPLAVGERVAHCRHDDACVTPSMSHDHPGVFRWRPLPVHEAATTATEYTPPDQCPACEQLEGAVERPCRQCRALFVPQRALLVPYLTALVEGEELAESYETVLARSMTCCPGCLGFLTRGE